MSDLLGIVGSISSPSNTRSAIEVALEAASDGFDIDTRTLHLGDLNLVTADGRKLEEYSGDTRKALDTIIDAEAFLVGTPVYRGSYSGLLKNLFDMIPRGKWQADVAPLENRAVGLVATGGSYHHFLSVSHELGPILDFFGSYQVGSGVYAQSQHFKDKQVTDPEIKKRLSTLGKATWELALALRDGEALNKLGPQF